MIVAMEAEQPLSSKIPIDRSKINPYRLLTIMRFIALGFFLHLRIRNPVKDAYALWLLSVICEIWFAMSWILEQLPKWSPIDRQAHLNRLSSRFEKEGEENCELAGIDIFVRTEDPEREPPLTTANAILSALAVDYPADKVSCYVSDDGSSLVTLECLSETAEFARRWVPFCKEFDVEPRAPEAYFSQKIDYLREKLKPGFVKKRREMKREYEEFKVGIDRLVTRRRRVFPDDGWTMRDGQPWPGNNPRDHPAIIQVFLGPTGAQDVTGKNLPLLVYVSRERRPGCHTHFRPGAMNALIRISEVLTNSPYILKMDCSHYINKSKVVREAMCFLMDPRLGQNVCYVQFPLRFHPIHQPHQYANITHNKLFYNITMKCLDAIQGPICMGNACVIRRQAFFGYAPSLQLQNCSHSWLARFKFLNKGGNDQNPQISSEIFGPPSDIESSDEYKSEIANLLHHLGSLKSLLDESITGPSSLINDAFRSISYSYEENTQWGKEIGWIYSSAADPILTGMKMHARGWRSIYCIPPRPAFKANGAMNLTNTLKQLLHCAFGSMGILLSKHCPLWMGLRSNRLKWLQRIAYINIVLYPLTSIPLITYSFLPAICLFTGKFIIAPLDNIGIMWVTGVVVSTVSSILLELEWGRVEIEEWWTNQQLWFIGGISSHLFAIVKALLKVCADREIIIATTARGEASLKSDKTEDSKRLLAFDYTYLLILPTTLLLVTTLAIVVGVTAALNNVKREWNSLLQKLCFTLWIVVPLFSFVRGVTGMQSRTPTLALMWSLILSSFLLLTWMRFHREENSKL